MSPLKIVMVGGGSVLWTPTLVRDLLLTPPLRGAEIVLYDVNKDASDLTAAFCTKLAATLGVPAHIVSTDRRERAFADADHVIITISTGGLDAMARDLAIPEEYGIYHTVGDTSGPGGWARTIRNFDTFVSLAQDINRYARGAMVLNYTNPMATLTDVLARLCEGPVVGLCHGLFNNLEFIQGLYGLESEDDIALQYGGLNHFFWITQARAGAVDVLADLTARLETHSFTDLLRLVHGPEAPAGEVATDLFRLTGVMPYLGDRHTCEFFPWYITSRDHLRASRLVRTPVAERREQATQEAENLRRMVGGEIPAEYRTRSRETAADIISAHVQGRAFIDVGNLPNTGQVAGLPKGVVVETAVRVDRTGFTPLTCGPLPRTAHHYVRLWAEIYAMIVDACFAQDKAAALRVLRLDPVCSHLNTAQVIEMGERLLASHAAFISLS
jgi:alpha-galactosidase